MALKKSQQGTSHSDNPVLFIPLYVYPYYWRSISIPWEGGDRSIHRRIEKQGNRRGNIFD